MKSTLTLSLSCTLLATLAGATQAGIQVDYYRTIAPNAFGSVNYAQMWSNVQDSLINNGGADTGSGASAFTNITSVNGQQSYVSSFENLNGVEVAGEYGTRPSWAYFISNDDGSVMDNSLLASATKNYGYSWNGVESSFWGDIDFIPGGNFDANRLVGVRADGSIGTSLADEYIAFIGLSGNAWWAERWTGTLGVDEVWTGDTMVGDADRFDRLAELAAWTEANQDYWAFSITMDGITFDAPNINVVPIPPAAFAGLAMLGGIAGVRTIRRRA